MMLRGTLASAFMISAACLSPIHAQTTRYWDINGVTDGAGGVAPAGTWNTVTANWNTDPSGGAAGAVSNWTAGDNAIFSAGADATGAFTVTLSGTQTASNVVFQEGDVTLNGGTALNLTGAATVTVGLVPGDHNADSRVDAADYVVWRKDPATFGGDPAGYDAWFTNFGAFSSSATSATVASVVGGSAGLTKAGTGTLHLTSANTYTGNTTISRDGGTLKLGAAGALPATTVLTLPAIANGGARVELFDLSGTPFDQTIAGLAGGGGGTTTPTIVDVGFATLTLDVPTGESHTYTGFLKTDYNIFDDSHGTVVKNGEGEIIIRQNNGSAPFAGEFVINEGTVGIGNNQAFGPVSSTNKLVINGDGGAPVTLTNATSPNASVNLAVATVDVGGSFEFNVNGASNTQFLGSGGNMIINLLVDNPTITVNPVAEVGTNGIFILAGEIRDGANSFGITKAGAGTLTINNGNNQYNGDTTILEGVVRLTKGLANQAVPFADGRLGDGTGTVHLSGGSLEYNGNLAGGQTDRRLTVPNPINVTADSAIIYDQTTINLTDNIIDFVFEGDLSGTGGTLSLRNERADDLPVAIFRPTFSGSGFTFGRPVVIDNGAAPHTTEMYSTNTTGTQSWSGVISGGGSFVRSGAGGTTVLSGNNTYTGNTIVEAGTLSITNAYLADTADVLLTTGSTLNLNFLGTDTIDQLFIDGLSQSTGTWGGLGSGASNETTLITGNGLLLVSAPGSGGAVPEPATLAMAFFGMAVLTAGRPRRRS